MFNNQRGQTIIEVLVALSTAVVIVSATTMAILTALKNTTGTQAQTSATRIAQEGIEFMRFLRDSDYDTFKNLKENVTYCLGKNASSLTISPSLVSTPNCGDNVDLFSRAIVIDTNAEECLPAIPPVPTPTPTPGGTTPTKITVYVSWTDSQCSNSVRCHQSVLTSCLSDFTVVSTPADIPTAIP